MKDGLRINKADLGKLVVIKPDLNTGGVDFLKAKPSAQGRLKRARGSIRY